MAVTPRLRAQPLDDVGGEPGRVAPAQQREAGDHMPQGSGGTAAVGALVDVVFDAVLLDRPELSVEIRGQPALGEDVVDMEPRAAHQTFDPRRVVAVQGRSRAPPRARL
ncbi:MAG: hypothetical protein M3P50_06660 [Actinomycetota bacterium]|nr:hypothetical protein [Actinomycetota bacterium]